MYTCVESLKSWKDTHVNQHQLVSLLCDLCHFPCTVSQIVADDYVFFYIGDHLNVFDKGGYLCAAVITKELDNCLINLHYWGWGYAYDECISVDSKRIQRRSGKDVSSTNVLSLISDQVQQIKENIIKKQPQVLVGNQQFQNVDRLNAYNKTEKAEIQGIVLACLDCVCTYVKERDMLVFPVEIPSVFISFLKSVVEEQLNLHLLKLGLKIVLNRYSIFMSLCD